ncbi:response regulator transcription factor [Ruminococcus flavefaciens]|uniref:Stage 0 sporulation protein A homolog n=1 Tax=Ruminococcus flavefaciens TaxID=1265 RepID=A0A1M7GQ28_RUMFL|nr:response regulator transcription factor [Ruminococcus flavefaciens]SHM17977.1 DNA-binding response regulator, OmpR family, contains REC and winged-helix (wHTH) domain [Ruminococcus flavefaciens]
MPKILIVDDEPNIVTLISRYAQRDGYDIVTASDGREAIDKCKTENFDVIIMDVMMPDTDGFTACKKIKEFKDIPVIMLSARGTEFDKLFGFEVGVDDYVTKPFSPVELMARIKVVISRKPVQKPDSADSRHIIVDGIDIDTLGRTVLIDGEKADLTAKEYALFLILVKNKGIVLSRDRILNEVWGYDSFGVDRTVDWQIKLLRSKLGAYRDSIKTVRGVGYKFEV